MAKNQKNEEVAVQEDVVDVTPVPVVSAPVAVKLISFDQWAAMKGVKPHHKAGMRAFCSDADKPRSKTAWDEVFNNY